MLCGWPFFFLHVESFDPYEPWDPRLYFVEEYLKNPGPHSWPEPPYQKIVDYWFGKILETTAELGLLDNTVIVFLSDHGVLLGEQGQFMKGEDRIRTQVTHVPLLIRLPGKQYAGKRVLGSVQHPDIVPTLLGRLNLKGSSRITGEDRWPYVTGEKDKPARTRCFRVRVRSGGSYPGVELLGSLEPREV